MTRQRMAEEYSRMICLEVKTSFLFTSLSSVAFPAKHLAILNLRSSTFTPRRNMVALHELVVVFFATNGTLMVLLFPYGKLNLVGKSTEVEVMLITCQNVRDDTLLFLNFIISYQVVDLLFHRLDIKHLLMIFVIEFRPIQVG